MGYVPRPGDNPDKYCYRPGLAGPIFKKAIAISILGHLAVFGIFNFSFGARIPPADYSQVFFWGSFLRRGDFAVPPFRRAISAEKAGLNKIALRNKNAENTLVARPYLKPLVNPHSGAQKLIFAQKAAAIIPAHKRNRKEIILYPGLPHHFLLYFKDRQMAHMELMFNILSQDRKNTILLRRKVSSGNLEADLLSMRYINHYLFIQQAAFVPDKWQAVKIDLSAKDD